jgi:hypothetical protein
MAKKVTIWLKDSGEAKTYENVHVEEDGHSGQVTAIRLYDGDIRALRAMFDYDLISRMEVEDSI